MKPFSKKFINKQAEIPERPRFYYDREPYDKAEERGKREVSKYDEEYTFLVRLIQTIGQVAPEAGQEMKDISNAYPFVTIDDVGDLAAKIWTLATTKYKIPADWLTKQLEKTASLKKATPDLWPAQEEADDMLNHAPGYLAYSYGQDKEAEGEFTGAEFSTDDVGVNPSLDNGPWSSPEDQGAKPQKSPFPNTDWLPADDENTDQQPASNVASSIKRPFSKKANPSTRYWIAPDGTEFNAGTHHGAWIKNNKETLKQYGISFTSIGTTWSDMIKNGWVRVSNEPAGSGFQIQIQDLNNIPSFLDDFVAKNYQQGDKIELGDQSGHLIAIDDPFPTLQKAVRKNLRQGSLKQAAIDSQFVNEILQAIHSNGGTTYNLLTGNMAGTPNYAVSIYPDRERIVDGVDFDVLEGYVEENEDLLSDVKNSFGAWSNNGKVYLDVVATIPDQAQAIELAKQHNQLAIYDLQNNKEIRTDNTNDVQKTADDQVLPQEQQDQIAAVTSPIYNTALNNYAQAVKRGHEKDRALEYAIQSVANIEKIDPKKLVELINQYL
jgi:hypothetical protein